MRAHVEIVSADDLVWRSAELPRSEGSARQQNLSYDEENGAASTRVIFDTGWSRPGGYHEADTEWYVLSGQVMLGDRALGASDYFRAPAGLYIPPIRASAGTVALVFREFGDWGFSVSEKSRDTVVPRGGNTDSDEPGELTVVQDTQAGWAANPYGTVSEQDFQRKLKLKILFHDPSPVRRDAGLADQPRLGAAGHGRHRSRRGAPSRLRGGLRPERADGLRLRDIPARLLLLPAAAGPACRLQGRRDRARAADARQRRPDQLEDREPGGGGRRPGGELRPG